VSSAIFLLPVIFLYFIYIRINVEDYFQFSVKDSSQSVLLAPDKTKTVMRILQNSYTGRYRYYFRNKLTLIAISKSGKIVDQFDYWPHDSVIVKQEKVESGNVFFRSKLRNRVRYLDKQDNEVLKALLGVNDKGLLVKGNQK
jgi:hypothetical protein